MKQPAGPTEKGTNAELSSRKAYPFLSPEWVHEVTRVLQASRATNQEFGKLASGFSVRLAYMVTELSERLAQLYGGQQLVVFVELTKGTVRQLQIGTTPPREKADFTVASNYGVVKRIFRGDLNAATAFIERQFKVEPMSRVYRRPRFTARAIVTGNLMLKIARGVPTTFFEDL